MVGSVLSITLLYRNIEGARSLTGDGNETSFRKLKFWKRPEYLATMMILFFVNMADRTFGPILTLFLAALGTPAGRLVLVSGALVSGAAFAEAFSAWISGRLASRISLRNLIGGRLVLSILVLMPMVFAGTSAQFSLLRVLLALLAGGTLTLALSAANRVIPAEHRGSGFALLASTSTLGNAAGPLISGMLAKRFSIPSVFVFDAIVYAVMIGFVYRNVRR
jgi:MFS family permease